MFKLLLIGFVPLFLLMGCAPEATPDSNTEVFKTADEISATRRAQQQQSWRKTAIEVLHDERPDVTAKAEEGLAIVIWADGARQRVDLSEVSPMLTAQPDQSVYILREYLLKQLVIFDQQRLTQMSFESARPRIRPMLMNGKDVQELSTELAQGSSLPTRAIFGDLYWIAVVRWEGTRPATPIGPKTLASWNIPAEQVQRQAISNLSSDPVASAFEITSFSTLGKVGTLKPGVDPAIVLSPNFLTVARQAIGTSDNLALLLATPQDVRFMEAGNKKLIDGLYTSFRSVITNNRKALSNRPLMLSENGIAPLNYTPQVLLNASTSRPVGNPAANTSKGRPTSRPATSKPAARPYMVR